MAIADWDETRADEIAADELRCLSGGAPNLTAQPTSLPPTIDQSPS